MFVVRLVIGALCAALLAACSGSGLGSAPASPVSPTMISDTSRTSDAETQWRGSGDGFAVWPTSLAFDSLGSRKTFVAEDRHHGSRGGWLEAGAASSDTAVCRVDPSDESSRDGSLTFTVTAVANGACHIDVHRHVGGWWARGNVRVDVTVAACPATPARTSGVTTFWNSTPQPSCSASPSPKPSPKPSATPTSCPSAAPRSWLLPAWNTTPQPSCSPVPTQSPSAAPSPTSRPTAEPSPTATPTVGPTVGPTVAPTAPPTATPKPSPSPSPSAPSLVCNDEPGEIRYPISPTGGTFVVPAGAAGTTATINYPANDAPMGSYACLAAVQNYPIAGNVHFDFHMIDPNQSTYATTVVTFGNGANAVVANPSWTADAGQYVEQIEESCNCVDDTEPGGYAQTNTSAVVTSAGTATEISPFDNGQLYFGSSDAESALDGSYTFYYQNPVPIPGT